MCFGSMWFDVCHGFLLRLPCTANTTENTSVKPPNSAFWRGSETPKESGVFGMLFSESDEVVRKKWVDRGKYMENALFVCDLCRPVKN